MAGLNGFPFLIPQLTSDQASQWNNDRLRYIGPLNRAQIEELYWRVNQYSLALPAIGITVTPWVWNPGDPTAMPPPTPTYQDGIPIPLSEAPNAAILLNMGPLATRYGRAAPLAPAIEPLLQCGNPTVGPINPLVFTGSGQSDNLDFSATLTLFIYPTFDSPLDDAGREILIPQLYYNAFEDDQQQYYVLWSFSGTVSLRSDSPLYSPTWAGSGFPGTVKQGSADTVYTSNNTNIAQGLIGNPDTLELTSAPTQIDVMLGLSVNAFGVIAPIVATIAASQWWSYNGRWNTSTGAYNV